MRLVAFVGDYIGNFVDAQAVLCVFRVDTAHGALMGADENFDGVLWYLKSRLTSSDVDTVCRCENVVAVDDGTAAVEVGATAFSHTNLPGKLAYLGVFAADYITWTIGVLPLD